MVEVYPDADPDETVTVTGVGHMTLREAIRKYDHCCEQHGPALIVYREIGKAPSMFDMIDLGRLAQMNRFR